MRGPPPQRPPRPRRALVVARQRGDLHKTHSDNQSNKYKDRWKVNSLSKTEIDDENINAGAEESEGSTSRRLNTQSYNKGPESLDRMRTRTDTRGLRRFLPCFKSD